MVCTHTDKGPAESSKASSEKLRRRNGPDADRGTTSRKAFREQQQGRRRQTEDTQDSETPYQERKRYQQRLPVVYKVFSEQIAAKSKALQEKLEATR